MPPAFFGAQGYGAGAIGGRGGQVIEVTNLANSGPGSFRAAIDTLGPRVVVFRVGGAIQLTAPLVLKNPFITIAGQTAPGGGIMLTGLPGLFRHQASQAIIRFLRFRSVLGVGEQGMGQSPLVISNGVEETIMDHLTVSWGGDDTGPWMGIGAPDTWIRKLTLMNCIFSEGLAGHSTGLLVGGTANYSAVPPVEQYLKVKDIDVHHCLFVHNYDRNPRFACASAKGVNNVVYNWGSRVGLLANGGSYDLINNYWKPGPMKNSAIIVKYERDTGSPPPSLYIAGNIVAGSFENPAADNKTLIQQNPVAGVGSLPLSYFRNTPLPDAQYPIVIQSALDAYASVLAKAGANARLDGNGAWVANPDSVDLRVLADVKNGTGWAAAVASPAAAGGFPVLAPGVPYVDTDKDGMPNVWETAQGLNPNSASDAKLVGAGGYTNVERYLNGPV